MPPTISRGFRGRRQDVPPGRVPPGQYVTRDFPVLSAGNEEYLLASIQQRGDGTGRAGRESRHAVSRRHCVLRQHQALHADAPKVTKQTKTSDLQTSVCGNPVPRVHPRPGG